jgi:hypothetical protein
MLFIWNLKSLFENQRDENVYDDSCRLKEAIAQISEKWQKADISMMACIIPTIHGKFYDENFFKISERSGLGLDISILKCFFLASSPRDLFQNLSQFKNFMMPVFNKLNIESEQQITFVYGLISALFGFKEGWEVLFEFAIENKMQEELFFLSPNDEVEDDQKRKCEIMKDLKTSLISSFLNLFDWNVLGYFSPYHHTVKYPIHILAKNYPKHKELTFVTLKMTDFLSKLARALYFKMGVTEDFHFSKMISPIVKIITFFQLDLSFLILGKKSLYSLMNLPKRKIP